jgi:hypothetical protein
MYNKIKLPKEYRFAGTEVKVKLCAQTHMLVVLGRPGDSINAK